MTRPRFRYTEKNSLVGLAILIGQSIICAAAMLVLIIWCLAILPGILE
jgi:hypothetical protein